MDIRSVTLFCSPDFDGDTAAPFLAAARDSFPFPVQTTRVATPPFPDWWLPGTGTTDRAQQLATRWRQAGADYMSLGPVLLRHDATWLEMVPELLSATDMLFANVEIADTAGQIDTGRCRQTAALMQKISTIIDNGFGNLYLTAIANCPPGSPFFPVAYHHTGEPAFAIAVESADLAVTAFAEAQTLAEARENLVTAIEDAARRLEAEAAQLVQSYAIPFAGIDFSLAPFPTPEKSLGAAMEALGLAHVGAPGSLFAAAFITEAIERASFNRCGFSGLMLPVLEDAVLAQRAATGKLQLTDLLSYAAVCGVGLDTIPLAGDISLENLTGILLDIAALATRLDKPLTARLMPLPGLNANDPVRFDFPYFANSGIMDIKGEGVHSPMLGHEQITLEAREKK